MPLKITGGSAKDRLYAKAIAAQVSRERQEANKKAEQWRDLQVKNMDKGSMPSPRELMSLGGQALTSGPVSDAPSAIQEMRERILEQERQRQEEAKRRALYQVQPEQTAKDLAGMRLEAGDYAQVGGKALTSGTAGFAAQNLGAYKRKKQADTSGPVQVDWMGVSAERNNRIDLLNQKLRELEAKREEQEKKARTSQEEQAAFWDARAKSTGYSVDESDRRSQAQKDAGKTASELKSQERQLGQYIKWLEGQGIQERAENITHHRDVHDGLLTDARGPISDGKNQAAKMLVEAIQARELWENPTGYDAPETLSMLGMADVMTDRQKDTMLAFAGRGDWDGASRYLSSITDTMNQKMADHRYQNMGAIEKALYWMPAGLERFGTGMSQLGKKETTSPSVASRISQMVQRDAYETHPALGFAYDMGASLSNMAPSMLMAYVAGPAMAAAGLPSAAAGAVAGGIGSAALGASAGGNAYAEKRRQGYGAEEAAAYATLVGASEAGLQYVLGGISKLGATPLAKATEMVSKIDNAFGQAAIKLGANMLSEGVEEGLQEVLEPAFATLILDEKYQVSPQEVVTSFLMGALTAGLLEGMGAVRAGRAGQEVARNGGFDATAVDGYMGESGVDYFRNVKNLEDTQLGFEILADYYSLTQQGADTTTMNDVVRQYAMRSAWYEGQEQARRATGQTAQPQQNAPQDAQEAQRQPEEVGDIHGPGVILDTTQATQEQAQGSVGQVWEGATQNTSGAPLQRVQTAHIPQPENLTPGTAGVDNGHRNTQILSEGAEIHEREADQSAAVPEGASAFDGRQGRVYREGPVQQAGGLEEGPAGARQTVEPGRATGGREHLAENLRGQEVSSRQLGLSSGTDAANVLVVPQEMWEPDMVQAAQEVQQKTGASVTYVLGNIEVARANGSLAKVKGVQMPGKIIVQADHPRFTVDQIAAHETFHDLTARDVGMVYEAEKRIKERYNPDELEKIVAVYTKKLRGIVDIPANATPEQMQAAELRIWEELCADAYAGMNAFDQDVSRYQETVQEVVREREAAAPSRENAQATERKTGPTSTSEATQETQRYKEIKVVRDAMRNAYAAGEISEAEYDAAMESIWAQAGVDGEELLEAWDRWDKEDGWERYSVNEEFQDNIEDWNRRGRPNDEVFIIGSTSDVLQGLGAIENDIYLKADKVNRIFSDHPEIKLSHIQEIPQLLDDPVLVLKSANGKTRSGLNTRMILYGSIKASNDKPIMVVMDLRPVEGKLLVNDMQKVNSIYTKDKPIGSLIRSDVMYADKKRTIPLLQSMGLHLRPKDLLRNGSIGSISYWNDAVKLEGVPFREVVNLSSTTESNQGKERFSVEDEETLTEFALGDDGNIYLPGQPVPEAVKRMRAKSLDRDGSSAYDGENQKGAVDYEQGSIGSRSAEIYLRDEWNGRSGANANHRGRERGIPGTLEKGERRDSEKVRGKEESSERYKNAIVEHPKTEGSNRAKIAASQYTKDIYFVKHESIQDEDTSNNRQRWGITTKDGTVLLSDRIPDHLGVSVGVHEAVHVAKRKGFTPYTDFLSEAIERIDQAADETIETLNTLAYARFNKEFMNLNVDEIETVYDELNAYVWGYHRSDAEKTKARFADIFTNYDDYIRELDAIMEQMRMSNMEESLPGQTAPEPVQQTPAMNEQANGPEKFSVEDEETLTEFALGDDGNIYLPGQPMPEAVKRMRAAQQKNASVDRNQLQPDQREAYSTEDTQEGIVDTLPRKAKDYLSRAEWAMVRKLGDLLNVPTSAQRDYLKETVREISEEYLKEGRVSQEAMDRLFEDAYSQGVIVQETLMDEYRELYDRLRSTDLVLAKEYTGDIPDFEAFRRKYFNRLKISTKGRTNIDQVYMELSEDWPGFFNNEEHTHPSDQLEHIAKVMDDFKRVERSMDEYYGGGAEDFKRGAKHDFEVAVTDMLGELRNVKRYADERAAAQTARQEAIPTTKEEVEESWRKVKEARKKYEKVNAKILLTNDDKVAVGRLLRGEIKLEHLDPSEVNVKDIKAVYQAKEEYERLAKGLKAWNRSRKEQLKTQADTFLETANDWKDKKAGIMYSRETMERNIRDIIKDKALADEIIATYFTPVHHGAAAATRMKNSYRERVRKLGLSRKEAKGNLVSEAHAVQLLGEAEDNIRVLEQSKGRVKERDGKTLEEWNGVVADLWKQNPNLDEGKIRNAIQEFRAIYDDLFQQMNEVRVRNGYEPVNYRQGYFPHFQPGNEEGILAAFGRAMGISTEVTALPTTINGLTHTFRPGIRWFGNAQERLGFNTAYDAVEGFDRYIEGVADVIHQTDNIQRLRALASQIRYRTGDEGIRRQVDAVRDNTTLAEQDKESRIEKIYKNGRFALSNFVVELDEYTNLLANKKSRADRNMEQAAGRRAYNIVKALESRVAANMVAVNPGSWLTNFIPLTQGGALLDRGMLLHGMWDTLRAYKGDDGFVDTSTFLTNRRGSDPLVKTWSQKASSVMSKPMEFIDQFTADSLVRARYRQNLAHGMSEDAAMTEADAWTAGVMADRSKGSMPTLFEHKNPLSKMFTQFQLEVNNQLSYLFKDMPRDTRDKGLHVLAAALIKFAVGAFLYDEVYEFIVGRRPALDPIGMLNDTVGDLTGWELPNLVELGVDAASGDITAEDFQTERGDLYDAAEGLAGNVAENLPFISGFLGGGRYPVMNALPDFQNAARAALDSDWNTEKKLYELSSGFENPLTYLLLPFGGGQLKKIYNGVKAAVQGGKYSVNSDGEEILQYPMFMDSRGESIANVTRAILFGTTSLPTGQEWVEEGFKSLTAEQTVAYKWMMEEGVTGREAFYLIKELRSATKTDDQSKAQVQRDILEKAGLNDGALEAAYYTMVATNKEREIIDAMEEVGADTGVVTRALMELKQANATTQTAVERVLKSVHGLTNAERRKLWQLQNTGWDEKKNPF